MKARACPHRGLPAVTGVSAWVWNAGIKKPGISMLARKGQEKCKFAGFELLP
jgi:hypothetical protein